MEFLNDLFVTASLTLALSFLVSKLISMAMAGGPGHRHSDEPITVEEMRSVQQLRVQSTPSERKAEFLVRKALENVDEFSAIQAESNLKIERGEIAVDSHVVEKFEEFQVERHLEIERDRGEITEDSDVQTVESSAVEHGEIKVVSDVVELPLMSSEGKSGEDIVSEVSKVVELTEESVQEKTEAHVQTVERSAVEHGEITVVSDVIELPLMSSEDKSGEEIVSKVSKVIELTEESVTEKITEMDVQRIECSAKQRNKEAVEEINEDRGIHDEPEEITVVKSDVKERDEEREVTVDLEEDDWEGIERSELEKEL